VDILFDLTDNDLYYDLTMEVSFDIGGTCAVGNILDINNAKGFTALPGGSRNSNGSFYYLGYLGFWWSSTEYSSSYAWYRGLSCYYANVYRGYDDKTSGQSVRCLKD